jgi:hypothetical protein
MKSAGEAIRLVTMQMYALAILLWLYLSFRIPPTIVEIKQSVDAMMAFIILKSVSLVGYTA